MGVTNTTRDEVGASRRLTFTVENSTGARVNADVTLVVTDPSGVDRVLTSTSTGTASAAVPSTNLNHLATGTWFANLKSTEPGRYTWQFRSTGAVHTAQAGAWVAAMPVAST